MRRVARLPTRLYADGAVARATSAEGLYGLARLTIHEAELDLNPQADPDAGGHGSGSAGQRWAGTEGARASPGTAVAPTRADFCVPSSP